MNLFFVCILIKPRAYIAYFFIEYLYQELIITFRKLTKETGWLIQIQTKLFC